MEKYTIVCPHCTGAVNATKQVRKILENDTIDSTKMVCPVCENTFLLAITMMGIRSFKLPL